jgi:hypothetical protein
MSREGATRSASKPGSRSSPAATRAGGPSSESWREEGVRATGVAGADELEGETAEEAEELELEELSDEEEEAELPVKPAVPEEEESEW